MLARLSALVIWALVAATGVFWGLRLWVRTPAVPANAVAVATATAAAGDMTRLLGAAPVEAPLALIAPEASARFRLVGVMAPKAGSAAAARPYGVALIAVDGKPARAFAVGAALDEELVLQSVSLRGASIGPAQGGSGLKLELPALPPPATGSLPGVGAAPAVFSVPPALGAAARQARLLVPSIPNPPPNPPNPDNGQPDNFNGAPTE